MVGVMVTIDTDAECAQSLYNALEYRIANDKSLVEGTNEYEQTMIMFHALSDMLNHMNGHGLPNLNGRN